jgi:hypothetical protein
LEPDLQKSFEISKSLKEEINSIKNLVTSISNNNIDLIKELKDEIQ